MFGALMTLWILVTPALGQVPTSDLYFTLDGTVYLPGDTVLITDIGVFTSNDPSGAGTSLVCRTELVNTQCCRGSDGGNVGEWFLPDGTMVPRNSAAPSADFTRSGVTHQVQLNRRNNALTPTGVYECRVPHGTTGEMVRATITLVTSRAILEVRIVTPDSGAVEGQSFTLRCEMTHAPLIHVLGGNISYSWTRERDRSQQLGNNMVYTFIPQTGDHGETYTCTATVTTAALSAPIVIRRSNIISVLEPPVLLVPVPTSTAIALSWTQSGSAVDRYTISYTYTIRRCGSDIVSGSREIRDSTARSYTLTNLEEDSEYDITLTAIRGNGRVSSNQISAITNIAAPSGSPGSLSFSDVTLTSITVQWTELPCSDRNGEITGYTVEYSSTTPPHTNTVTVSGSENTSLVVGELSPRTRYNFSVRALGVARSGAASNSMFTGTPTEGGLFLRGRILSNNTMQELSDIREGSGALYCLTDRILCCSRNAGSSRGLWRFPNGSLAEDQAAIGLYLIRGFSSLLLNRRSNTVGPTGVYTCVVPDDDNILRTLYIGIYNNTAGHDPLTVSLSYDPTSHTLTCVSSGGPVNTVSWRRNGVVVSFLPHQLGQSLVDAVTSTYHNYFTITSQNISHYSGSYECTVTTSRESTTSSPSSAEAIAITPNRTYRLGETSAITCSTPVPVQTIQWLDGSNTVVREGTVVQELVLELLIEDRHNNSRFTCRVRHVDFMETQEINIVIAVAPVLHQAIPTSTTIALSWTQGGKSVDSYMLSFNCTIRDPECGSGPAPENNAVVETIRDGTARSYTLTNLEEDSEYDITLTAIRGNGRALSNQTSAITHTAAPSGSPGPLSFSDVNLTSITVQWTELPCSDRNGEITGYTVEYSSTTPPHTNTVTVSGSNNTRLVVGGLLPRTSYTFSVRAQGPAGTSDSATASRFTATPTGVGFFLNGSLLSNNSIVLLSDIGEGSGALYCLTDRRPCCSREAGGERGLWRFPDGSEATETSTGVYRTRGFSSLFLNRRSSAVGPTGVYICLMPDSWNILRTLYIGVYSSHSRGSLTVSLSYNCTSHTLTCVSSGGPVNTVTWTRNGAVISSSSYELEQSLATATTSTYHHLLTVTSGDVEDYVGSFTCTVSNSRGNTTSQSMDINDIVITGHEGIHQIWSSANITCSSDLAVQTIRWLNDSDNGQQLYNNSGQQDLLLPINSIILSNITYLCEVQVLLASGVRVIQQNITVQVLSVPPSIPPKDVRVTRLTSTLMVVSWVPLHFFEARGFISHYTVAYSPRDQEELNSTLVIPGMNTSAARIGGLDANADYIVQVSATNAAGTSELSMSVESLRLHTYEGGPFDKDLIVIIALAVLCLIGFTVVIVVSVKLWLAPRKNTSPQTKDDPQTMDEQEMETIQTTTTSEPYQEMNKCTVQSEDIYTEVFSLSPRYAVGQEKQEAQYVNVGRKN